MSSIPVPPTPPLPGRTRSIIYAVWAWASVLLGAVMVSVAVIGDVPVVLVAVSVGLNFVGAACGFLAKNNVR